MNKNGNLKVNHGKLRVAELVNE